MMPARLGEGMIACCRVCCDHTGPGSCARSRGGGRGRNLALHRVLFDGKRFHEYRAAMVPNVKTHGTGCTFSAAIAANLALGHGLTESIARAKRAADGGSCAPT